MNGIGFLVVKDPDDTAIWRPKQAVSGVLGSNALRDVKKAVDQHHLPIHPEIRSFLALYEEIPASVKQDLKVSKRPVLVPARSLQVLEGSVQPTSVPYTAIIEENTVPLRRGVVLGPSVVSVDDRGTVPFQVANFRNSDVYLRLRTAIGTLSRAEVDSPVIIAEVNNFEVQVCAEVNGKGYLQRVIRSLCFPACVGSERKVCCEYSALNNKTRADAYSKEAFRIATGGLYEYLRMPFGLTNAPGSFMRLMNPISDENFQTLSVYLDDILLFGSSSEETLERLDMVFGRLAKYNLKLKPEKCQLFKKRFRYLGHFISESGIAPDPEKFRAITDWQKPRTETQLRGFLGIAGYYRKFVLGFAAIAAPLHSMLHGVKSKEDKLRVKGIKDWDESCNKAFNELKKKISSAPILGHPDFTKPYILEVDASNLGLGAVLSLDQDGHKSGSCICQSFSLTS
ncbi:uncharacterized protein LOC135461855 [Liolophura sinensis]|uniref:uncharacterized protein LOC135461855 n=1 Tax=Liolophura sinensis TaxID=3198878 RepID=UPI003158DFCC